MSHWRLFHGDVAEVSTREYHAARGRTRHLEQDIDRERLQCAAILALLAQRRLGRPATLVDLGCGDGGLLSLVGRHVEDAWGYDFTPANATGWPERGVKAEQLDVFGEDASLIRFADITVVTEVLEHLTDPFTAVRWVSRNSPYIVASSPWDETGESFCDSHAWAFDHNGYRSLIEDGGFRILEHVFVGRFQVVLGVRR